MNNNYEIVKNINKLYSGNCTWFLDGKLQREVRSKISGIKYNVYYPYVDSEKVIFYVDEEPNVTLIELIPRSDIKHSDIMGALFGLGLDSSTFGDIIIDHGKYYVYVLELIKDFILTNLNYIGNVSVEVRETDINLLVTYEKKYETIEIISSSERIDSIMSKIIHSNRDEINKKIRDKEIIVNYDIVVNGSKKLKPGDVFSIRKFGKYKYIGIVKNTKKGNLILKINRYI